MPAPTALMRFPSAVPRDPAIDEWFRAHAGELGAIARRWFEVLRACGDDVRELLHDGHPTACIGDAAFGYVNAFTAHVNVGFFRGAELADPAGLLEGSGKFMRHVKLRPGEDVDGGALTRLIATAYADMKRRARSEEAAARVADGKTNLMTEKKRAAAPKKTAAKRRTTAATKLPKTFTRSPSGKTTAPRLLSGGNPQIAKADGDAPVQAYIAAMPGWKRDVGRRLDALVVRAVPAVRKAVKWNSPFYGTEGEGWFLGVHVFAKYVKVAFFQGASLRPLPPGTSKQKDVRYLYIREEDVMDEPQFMAWVKQASRLPGWGKV